MTVLELVRLLPEVNWAARVIENRQEVLKNIGFEAGSRKKKELNEESIRQLLLADISKNRKREQDEAYYESKRQCLWNSVEKDLDYLQPVDLERLGKFIDKSSNKYVQQAVCYKKTRYCKVKDIPHQEMLKPAKFNPDHRPEGKGGNKRGETTEWDLDCGLVRQRETYQRKGRTEACKTGVTEGKPQKRKTVGTWITAYSEREKHCEKEGQDNETGNTTPNLRLKRISQTVQSSTKGFAGNAGLYYTSFEQATHRTLICNISSKYCMTFDLLNFKIVPSRLFSMQGMTLHIIDIDNP
ncbi:hypothetical protein JB92DRAFT_3103089 [Gautieria morchelliformis]|nr:hypothetical protein JB92DRAFT_3103089 [Gautieria morchelliformis]